MGNSNNGLTLNDVQLLIICATHANPRALNSWEIPSNQDSVKKLVSEGLIDPRDSFRATSRANAWLDHIRTIPLPVMEWRIPDAS